jgi:hypothetical protein
MFHMYQEELIQCLHQKKIKMGKLFVKIGLWIQKIWCKFQCKWNWMISKLIFNVKECPVAQCVCKK